MAASPTSSVHHESRAELQRVYDSMTLAELQVEYVRVIGAPPQDPDDIEGMIAHMVHVLTRSAAETLAS
jgi:hypothetical protein